MAKYSEQRMFEKLSEFSNSRRKKTDLKKYPDGGEYLTVDGEYHRVYKNANGDVIVNHPQEDKGKWDTINLTDKADAKTVAQGVAATRKWHRENPIKSYAEGGLTKFVGGGNPGDKYYRYQNTQYKKDQQGNWYKWNGKTWIMSGNGSSAYDMDNYMHPEDYLQRGRMQADDSNWGNDKPKATVSNYEIQRNQTLNSPFATTTQKIKATNSPIASNVKIQQDLYKQKEKEDKQKELERLEEQRQQHLRTVGSDNTRVDNSIITNNSLGNIPNILEQTLSITKAQNDAARQIVARGDFAQHFPELYKEYMSKENGNREGGPLSMQDIVLREMRTNPDFFSTLESRKEAAWKKSEQRIYDNLAWWEKGLNATQAFIADPLMVTNNALFRGEGPMVGQGEWSIDPERFSAEDNYYYDKFSGKSNSTFNNMLNVVNIGRAGAGAGLALREGDYGDAVFNLATVIPMVKGAKYGWKGLNALIKTQPLKYIPGLAGTSWGGMTTGQALAGYGAYHGLGHNLPKAYDAYSSGDWKTGNEELFMGIANTLPFVAEARLGIPSVLDDITMAGAKIKQGYNTVAQGESVLPFAWKNPAANLDGAVSETMFNKILQSDDFTPAEKAMLKEYQFSNYPFVKPGPKQDAFNELIGKANLKFPEDAVVTRAFSNPERDFQAFTGASDDIKTISIQDRPSAFSTGVSNKDRYYYGNTDRIVLSGKNLKKVEGNFAKQRYEPLEQGYYTNIPDEELTVIDNSKGSRLIGDSYYGTQRLSSEEVMAQAEALYAEQNARYSDVSGLGPKPPKDPNFLTGKPKSGNPADGVYTAEESAEIFTNEVNDYNENLRLFADPANKEEAIQKILDRTRPGFANTKGPVDELELFGSGFDMKVVGKFPNKHGGFDYVVKPRNIRTLKKPNAQSQPNWQKPSETQLKQEYHVEHELKGNTFFNSEDEFMSAVKNGTVEEITPELDASIGYRSRTGSKDAMIDLSKGYKSWPEFRNENTINAIYDGLSSGKDMDMPIVLEFSDGTRRVFSGNTRMDAAFQLGKNPKVLVVKVPNNKALNSIEVDTTPLPSKLSDKPITYGESSDLTIGPDKMSGMKYTRIANEAEKQKLLNESPEKITSVYREQWPSKGYESADDFPMSRAGQQQALDESTDFALKWAFKDSDVFKKADKILAPSIKRLNEIKGTNDPRGGLYKNAVESLNRQLRSINAQDQDDAIKEFLKLNPDKTIADIGDHTSELVQILAKQNPNNGIMQRLLQTSESVLNMEKEAKQLQSTIGEQMKTIEANIDPKFKDKILKIYEDTMRDDPARFDQIKTKIDEPYASGIADKFTGLEDKIKLVHPAKHEPSFQSLSPFEKMYVGNNYDNIGGVAMENSTITLGSKPNTLANQFMGVVIPETETLETASDPKVIHFIDQYMKAPDRIAEVNTHELGHNFQKFYGNWISRLQQNDPSYGYFVTRQDPKSELLTMMKEVMVEPTVPTTDAKMVTSMTDQTWLAAPNELHSDLMIARYKLAKELMKTYNISMEEAIANIKAPENQDYYAEWLMKDPEVAPHFKEDAPNELKAGIVKYLPILIPAAGYGVVQGMNSDTPKNKYGGNIKTLSKFIRK